MLRVRYAVAKVAVLLAGAGAFACSDDSGTGGSPDAGTHDHDHGGAIDPDSSTDCSLRTDLDSYAANMKKPGRNGVYSFQLVEGMPAPPIKGTNTWTLKVTQSDGAPIAEGLTAVADMPEHGHANPIQPMVAFDAATGSYTVMPVYFSMVGRWRVKFTVSGATATDTIDFAEFNFCIS